MSASEIASKENYFWMKRATRYMSILLVFLDWYREKIAREGEKSEMCNAFYYIMLHCDRQELGVHALASTLWH